MTIVMTILADDNARNRRRAKRAAAREAAMTVTGCKNRVEQALRAPNWREPKETAFVTLECQEYRKVRNPDGQQVNARQKMRGKSIPLI
jgi:hypothetical protein